MAKVDRPPIRTIGLRKYLADTAGIHNGLDYDLFALLKSEKINASNALIARLYNVDRRTVRNWSSILKEDLARER